jgi:Putative peptidoglycan binding domain
MAHWAHKFVGFAALTVLATSLAGAQTSKASSHKTSKSAHHKKVRKPRGQQAIDGTRCREIQEALVREHYITGQPSGKWDDVTQQAMRRYQADQGWQNKSIPDSRALIRLGLGPDHEHLLNPESAMTSAPQLPHGTSSTARPSSARAPVWQPKTASQPSMPVQSSPVATPVGAPSDISPER